MDQEVYPESFSGRAFQHLYSIIRIALILAWVIQANSSSEL